VSGGVGEERLRDFRRKRQNGKRSPPEKEGSKCRTAVHIGEKEGGKNQKRTRKKGNTTLGFGGRKIGERAAALKDRGGGALSRKKGGRYRKKRKSLGCWEKKEKTAERGEEDNDRTMAKGVRSKVTILRGQGCHMARLFREKRGPGAKSKTRNNSLLYRGGKEVRRGEEGAII